MSENKMVSTQEYPQQPDVIVWKFGEKVDHNAIGEINQFLEKYISEDKINMIADFTETENIDGSVIGVLMGARSRLQGLKGDFLVAAVNPKLEKAFHAMGVHRIFDFYPNIYEAARRFQDKAKVETMKVSFPGSLDYVPGIRDLICYIAKMRGFSEKEAYRIQTIVDEVCNNAIEHGSKNSDEPIMVVCTVDDEKIDLTIEDRGSDKASAEGLKKAVAKVQFTEQGKVNVQKRGRGLPIVAMLSDMVEIDTRSTPGTKIHIVKFKSKNRDEYFTL